jgi:hypothetical protein
MRPWTAEGGAVARGPGLIYESRDLAWFAGRPIRSELDGHMTACRLDVLLAGGSVVNPMPRRRVRRAIMPLMGRSLAATMILGLAAACSHLKPLEPLVRSVPLIPLGPSRLVPGHRISVAGRAWFDCGFIHDPAVGVPVRLIRKQDERVVGETTTDRDGRFSIQSSPQTKRSVPLIVQVGAVWLELPGGARNGTPLKILVPCPQES